MKFYFFWILNLCFLPVFLNAQNYLPDDYLSKDFHRGRREAFRALMPKNSVAVVFSYSERVFSNDVKYYYHPNPDLYYLTGYREPDAVLLIFKDIQEKDGDTFNELFFVRKRNPLKETWEGIRLGPEGVKNKLGFTHVFNGSEFYDFPLDFSSFDVIIHDEFPVDVIEDESGYDVYGLMESFKIKANIHYNREKIKLQNMHKSLKKSLSSENLEYFISYCKKLSLVNEEVRNDKIIKRVINNPDKQEIENIKSDILIKNQGIDIFKDITRTLREVKTEEELVLIRKAIHMSCIAHNEVIKSATPDMSENKAHGIHLYVHKYYGSEDEGYAPIVGAGANGCILHYNNNIRQRLNNDLLLMDVGAEYHGYTADVTRTIPATGKFSAEQKAIYEIVYEAQEEIFKICKEGTPFVDLNKKAREVIAKGLLKLGIIQHANEVSIYYPHGCSHYLGLDVHDKGMYGNLKANSVITVEPGIYIPPNSKCDKKWWNIGVRIEDDILILKDGYENLSAMSPRKWDEIEKLARKKSKFNEMNLPEIK
jgi:Xaa-Pro aminopeptidase